MSFYTCMHYLSEFLGGLCVNILPPDDDKEALAENESYRILLATPSMFAALEILLFCTLVRHETAKWYLANG